jgi:hypothetical protein
MALEVRPPLGDSELAAIRVALTRASLPLDQQPALYASSWRRAALREAVDDEPERQSRRHALSPRSTRGATRA